MPPNTTEPQVTPQLPPDDPTSLLPKKLVRARPLFDPEIVRKATAASFAKLNPVTLVKNPVMFVVEVGAAITTVFLIRDMFTGGGAIGFQIQISFWLWFTVLFANFAEAMAEARGKAQADALRKTKTDVLAKRLTAAGKIEQVQGSMLRVGDIVVCDASDLIPGDGEVIEGVATVDESVITGESAPVIRESGGDRSAVTGGTRVLSDQIKIKITSNPGETFLDRMIALVEGARAPEDAERDRAEHSDRGPDADFPARGDHAAALFGVQRRASGLGIDSNRRGPGLVAGVPDPDDHRRAAFRHRHRRHGSRDAAQRAGHERQGGGGRWRRQFVAAR